MSYEYAPRGLQFFVKDIVENPPKLVVRYQRSSGHKKYTGLIRPVFEQYVQTNDLQGFETWTRTLRPRQLLTLATMFHLTLDERWKHALLLRIDPSITTNYRMFHILLDVLYDTCATSHLWAPIQRSFNAHTERIVRRVPNYLRDAWSQYISSSDPMSFLADRANHSTERFVGILADFYVEEYHKFFREVLFKVFSTAKEPFYSREEELFKATFDKAPASERQSMVASLIRNCALDDVGELGKFVYIQMGTYLKKPSLWHLVPDAERRKFSSWIMRRELKNFFEGVNQHHERYQYWQKYASSLEDVIIIDRKQTMVMFFHDVAIMEVLGTGAVYVYSRDVFDEHFGKKIDRLIARREMSVFADISREDIRNMELVYRGTGRLIHHGRWQYEFDSWLKRNLGWEVDARVLAVKENQTY